MLSVKMNNNYGINIGNLQNSEGIKLPLILPLSTGGFIVEYSLDKSQEALQFIQKLTLSYITALSEQLVTIHTFDFSLKNPFKELAQLKDTGIYNSYSEKKALKAYEELEELVRYRHYELLTGYEDIHSYNQNSPQKEKFHIVLWNIEHIVSQFGTIKDIKSFIEASREAGVYIIAYASDEALISLSNNDRKEIVKSSQIISTAYSVIKINDKQTQLIAVDDQTIKLKELIKRFKFNHNVDTDNAKIYQQANDIKERLLLDSNDKSEDFLRIPIGTTLDGRTEINFSLGDRSSVYHAFIAGTNGTGKTTLINNIILGIAENFTANQVKLYLMDYKQGVEFQVFEKHPNCEHLFLDNTNVAAAINLIDDFANLINTRSELFKDAAVSNIDDYNKTQSSKVIPRIILVIDEVQRLFSGGYKEQSHFEQQLEYVVRQGRSFGIHIIMSTQTLTGANISPAIMSQIPLRIAFKLIGSEIWKIYASNNDEPARLGKYQFIYNNEAGEKTGNTIARAMPPREVSSILSTVISSRHKEEMIFPKISNKTTATSTEEAEKRESSHDIENVASIEIDKFQPFDLTEYSEMMDKLNVTEEVATNNE